MEKKCSKGHQWYEISTLPEAEGEPGVDDLCPYCLREELGDSLEGIGRVKTVPDKGA